MTGEPDTGWIAKTSAKPGRDSAPERWVLHASPEWSESQLEQDCEWVAGELVSDFRDLVGELEADGVTAHRWRFAIPPEPLNEKCLFDAELGLGACGDWCAGPRVEGAFLSGSALSGRIMGTLAA